MTYLVILSQGQVVNVFIARNFNFSHPTLGAQIGVWMHMVLHTILF